MIINEEDWDWHQKVYSIHTTFHLSADYWGGGGGGGISRTGGSDVKGIISKGGGYGAAHGRRESLFLVVLADHGAIY
jgi:hypothetical protein